MEKKSTLDGFDWSQYRRRSGNTTRLVDAGIQIVFSGHICVCKDHHMTGSQRLLELILRRLKVEHHLDTNNGIKVDRVSLEISYVPPSKDKNP